MRILVAYYSRTGNTKKIAESVSAECGADIARVTDVHSRTGAFGYLRSGYEAMTKRLGPIQPVEKDAGQYDLVILGSPVWTMNLASPMRTYLTERQTDFKKVAFFCTEGSAGGEGVFKQMADLCGKQPVASLIITETELKSGGYRKKVDRFAEEVAAAPTTAAGRRTAS